MILETKTSNASPNQLPFRTENVKEFEYWEERLTYLTIVKEGGEQTTWIGRKIVEVKHEE